MSSSSPHLPLALFSSLISCFLPLLFLHPFPPPPTLLPFFPPAAPFLFGLSLLLLFPPSSRPSTPLFLNNCSHFLKSSSFYLPTHLFSYFLHLFLSFSFLPHPKVAYLLLHFIYTLPLILFVLFLCSQYSFTPPPFSTPFSSLVEKPAETQTSIRLASQLVRAPNS
jgi:hypothetical protein